MLRSIVNIPCGIRVATSPILNINKFARFTRYNSTKPDDPLASLTSDTAKATPSFAIDALLNRSIEKSDIFSAGYRSKFESSMEQTPRDIAKSIREFTMSSGRSVDVRYGNVSKGIGSVGKLMKDNRVFIIARRQQRHIRPALLRKLKRREWWRSKFASDFHTLMQKINNAKRRGY
ncbi:hypothetical protein JA1_004241 [Spathaspora sp. JA1]|nr:hypothetical protein JA1_004241 [Spathaspora sp. JA1]